MNIISFLFPTNDSDFYACPFEYFFGECHPVLCISDSTGSSRIDHFYTLLVNQTSEGFHSSKSPFPGVLSNIAFVDSALTDLYCDFFFIERLKIITVYRGKKQMESISS